jgi:hypothetical protein
MNYRKALAATILTILEFAGAATLAPHSAGSGAPQQNEEAIAKALADRLRDKLGFEGGTVTAPPETEPPVLYPIKVRGGDVPITISTIRRFNGGVVVFAHFKFKRGAKAAGLYGKGLAPGECAWIDRRMNPDEPCELLFYGFDAKVHFEPGSRAGTSGYQIGMEVRSNRGGKSHPWYKDFFQSFSDPSFVTEFSVTKSKDGKFLIAGLN